MNEKQRFDQLDLLLTELIHSNEKLTHSNQISEKRLEALERLQYIVFPVLTITGAGTLFAILKLLGIF